MHSGLLQRVVHKKKASLHECCHTMHASQLSAREGRGEVSHDGLKSTNPEDVCRRNSAIQKSCRVPDSYLGWVLNPDPDAV
jgi:hypothetical protein